MRHELGFRFLLLVLVPSMILPASKGYFFSTKEKRVLSMYLFFFFFYLFYLLIFLYGGKRLATSGNRHKGMNLTYGLIHLHTVT